MLKVFAEPSGNRGGAGSQNRVGSGNNYGRSSAAQRRGKESQGNYIRRMGGSLFGPLENPREQRGKYAGTRRPH